MLSTPLVFLDTETTGLSVRKDRIIEVGLIRVENNKEVGRFQTLINPQTYISPLITQITSIDAKDLENAPEFSDIARELYDFLDGATLVAHNARFDYGFLRNEFMRVEKYYKAQQLCSAKLSRMLFPQYPHHNLDSIIERFAIPVEQRHRAFDDAKVVWEFFQKLYTSIPEETLMNAVNYLLRHPSLPRNLDKLSVQELPESSGVYIFYDENNTPLYVGKSVNIKSRVMSHFSNDYKESREMHVSQQIKRIETIPTAEELGALLKESELIKSLQPIYNRKLRASRRLIALREDVNKEGYMEVKLEEIMEIDPLNTRSIITTCKSVRQAKEYLHFLKTKYGLCEKLLGLEKTKSSCFSYRLSNCKGACIGKESPLSYNARCIIAFSQNKIKPWPFAGPIILTEENEFEKTKDEFWVDKWCLLGKRSGNGEDNGEFQEQDYRFDMDTYKILLHFIDTQEKKRQLRATVIKNESFKSQEI